MTTPQIVLLVVGILVLQVLIWVPVFRWMRRRGEAMTATLRGELEARGETIELAPAMGLYSGGTGEYPRIKGNAIIALTDRKLYIRRLVAAPIEVDRDKLVGAREEKWFLRAYKGHPFVVLSIAGGAEIGFIVADRGPWLAAFPRSAAV